MGDRANIFFVDDLGGTVAKGVYLYSHWGGQDLPEELRQALNTTPARARWDDPAYLCRILVLEVLKDLQGKETGAGLGTSRTRGDGYPVLIVDLVNQRVAFAPAGQETDAKKWMRTTSFADFAARPARW